MVKIKLGLKNSGTTAAPGIHPVTDTSSEILAANADRAWACVTNTSAETVYIAFGRPAVALRGLPLIRNAAYVVGGDNHTTESITGITESGTANVAHLESTDE